MQKRQDPKYISVNKSGHHTDPETIRGLEDHKSFGVTSKNQTSNNMNKDDESNVEIGS